MLECHIDDILSLPLIPRFVKETNLDIHWDGLHVYKNLGTRKVLAATLLYVISKTCKVPEYENGLLISADKCQRFNFRHLVAERKRPVWQTIESTVLKNEIHSLLHTQLEELSIGLLPSYKSVILQFNFSIKKLTAHDLVALNHSFAQIEKIIHKGLTT
jgi:hypothetical protein